MIFLATVSLALALLFPLWSSRGRRDRVEGAAADVRLVAEAARSVLIQSRSWPTATAPGQSPPELAGVLAQDSPFVRPGYALEWTTWSVVDSVDAPSDVVPTLGDAPPDSVGPTQRSVVRTIGAIAVHSGDLTLLAELTQQFAEEASFVLDTIWMLALPDRSEAAATAP